MGKSWKNPLKQATAAKKGALISKLAKEIFVATKLGGPDPSHNSRLRLALNQARAESVPKDTMERAIQKGSNSLDNEGNIQEVLYEGYTPHQVGVLVECQTDNRARTASEIRFLFKKHGGQMGEQGSLMWMFERRGYIEAKPPKDREVDVEEEAIEAGANELGPIQKEGESLFWFDSDPGDLDPVQKILQSRGWDILAFELSYRAKNKTENLTEKQKQEVYKFLDLLDENEDTWKIHTTL